MYGPAQKWWGRSQARGETTYFGALTGRVASWIAGALLILDETECKLYPPISETLFPIVLFGDEAFTVCVSWLEVRLIHFCLICEIHPKIFLNLSSLGQNVDIIPVHSVPDPKVDWANFYQWLLTWCQNTESTIRFLIGTKCRRQEQKYLLVYSVN